MLRTCLAAATGLVLLATPAACAVIHVDVAGGGDFTTIPEGVDAAADGDTVLVAPGTYAGALNRGIEAHDITIAPKGGPEVTVVDCELESFAFETYGVDLSGFTIRRGAGSMSTGYASLLVRNGAISDCVFRGCNGVALRVGYENPWFTRCLFEDNSGLVSGALGDSVLENNCSFSNASGDSLPQRRRNRADIIEDPLFCDLQGGDYMHCENSPSLTENEPVGVVMGAYTDAAGCGPCSSPVSVRSWGAIKALYR